MAAKKLLFKPSVEFFTVAAALFSLIIFFSLIGKYKNYNLTNATNNPSDLLSYMVGATIVKEGNVKNLYDFRVQKETQSRLVLPYKIDDGLLTFRGPPLTALLYVPLTYFPPTATFYAVIAVNFFLLLVTVWVLFLHLKISRKYFLPFISFLFLFLPIFVNSVMGQPSMLLTLVIVVSLSASGRKSFVSGLILALLFLKPQFILFVPLIFLYQNNREQKILFLKGFIVGSLVFWFVNFIMYGSGLFVDYPLFLFQSESNAYGTSAEQNYNLVSIFWKMTKNHQLSNIIAGVVSLFAYFLVLYRYGKKTVEQKHLAGLFTLIPLINFHTMISDLVVYVIPLAIILKYFTQQKIGTKTLLFIFSLFWIATWIGVYGLQYISTTALIILSFEMLARWESWGLNKKDQKVRAGSMGRI